MGREMFRLKVTENSYERTLSTKESNECYLMITKDALKLFPTAGETFELRIGNYVYDAYIRSMPCTCMGPDKPHSHYYLEGDYKERVKWGKGKVMHIKKLSNSIYLLSQD